MCLWMIEFAIGRKYNGKSIGKCKLIELNLNWGKIIETAKVSRERKCNRENPKIDEKICRWNFLAKSVEDDQTSV